MEHRLPAGGRIDRSRPLSFRFNGETLTGYAGDTLASALIASGRHLVARSFKYHRPRGILTAGVEEPNAMVQLGRGAHTVPNLKATEIALFDGLEAESVNCWPGVGFDVRAAAGWFSALLPAGFYYKTFMLSQPLWMTLFEPMLRQASGWGRAPEAPDPDVYDHKHVHCDVLVVGGGAAGLAAASRAAGAGARVILADEQEEFGGRLLSLAREIDGAAGHDWVSDRLKELRTGEDVRLLPRTTVFGYYHHNYLCALERRSTDGASGSSPGSPRLRLWHIRAGQVVLATGAHERPLVFPNNDRPGVMLASAAQSYVNRYAALPGRRAVLVTNNDGAYEAALDLQAAGIDIAAVADLRAEAGGDLPERARAAGIDCLAGRYVADVSGGRHVRGVRLSGMSETTGPTRTVDCDLVLTSGGWNPAVHLFSQSQGRLAYDDERACFLPGSPLEATHCAGTVAGAASLAEAIAQGRAAGATAVDRAGFACPEPDPAPHCNEPDLGGGEANRFAPVSPLPERLQAVSFVDLQNDATARDVRLAAREGFDSAEHMKRYTLAGFGTDQGKTGNVNALGVLADAVGKPVPEIGTTTFRAPYTPVFFGAMAGREVGRMNDPVRVTAIHPWHEANGAVFEDVGQWKRPWYFPRPGEDMRAAVDRECLAVRNGVGMLDASTLGKIDIRGPDAAELLERVYTNRWKGLKVGRIRYGVMCGEDGMIFDDGTTARLADDRFLMTTTTGGAAAVLDWLEEYLQTEWPDLRVYCTSVTEQWATVSVAGPKARDVVARVCPDVDLDPEAFPHLSLAEGTAAGVPARLFRISFTGELTYEINVPWWSGRHLWEALLDAGREEGIAPYGTEAMHVLRAEKGFVVVGQDTDGTVTPRDLGMDWIVSQKKPDFIGRRSFDRSDTRRADRRQLVGIATSDGSTVLPEGAQLVTDVSAPPPVPMIGHVTSSYYSACLGRSIALALVDGGRSRMGETVFAPLETGAVECRIVDPFFYDPEGARMNG